MNDSKELPRWDLRPFFADVEGPEFEAAFRDAGERVAALTALFDRYEIGVVRSVDGNAAEVFEIVFPSFLEARTRIHELEAYLECLVAADTRHAAAQARLSELQPSLASAQLLHTRLTAWCGALDTAALRRASPLAEAHAFFLEQSRTWAAHLMTPAEESLAAELVLTASTAWEKLHSDVTSQVVVSMEVEGEIRRLPMTAVRILAHDPRRSVRHNAYRAEIEAWRAVEVPLAAAMNSIKGEVGVLMRRRRWSSPLEATLLDHAIDRPILAAMHRAVEESFPDFRRYLRAKARLLGTPSLAWWDLYAPVHEGGEAWDYSRAETFIRRHFEGFSPLLSETARRAFDERWIDAGPRPGKVGGAFCMWLRGEDSRILSNFTPTRQGMLTLAHELGHAYHNRARAQRSIVQRRTPSTLAETASIFCETLIEQAAFDQAGESERLGILEAFLQGGCAVVVDVTGRFYFEQAVFERRGNRALSSDELCQEMRRAQERSYGDGLDPETYHPYMWAVKPHYYSGASSYYNYPYTFGYLFGLGLYAIYRARPESFVIAYEDLLSRTGMATADELAAGFGIDLRSTAFWRAGLDQVRERIEAFVGIVEERNKAS